MQHGIILAAPFLGEPTIHALGLQAAQGSYFSSPFYWGRDAGSREFSDRLVQLVPNERPNKNFANAYAGAFHYLKVGAQMGVAAAKADGRAVVRAMKATPMQDSLFGTSIIREDGQAMHDMLLLKVKTPQQTKSEWDLCSVVSVLPAVQAARPLAEGGCKLVRS
jgi:branched-chain amino acid transport system substrate-binding protein